MDNASEIKNQSNESRPWVAIAVAIIGLIASIGAAVVSSQKIADWFIKERTSGGRIESDGTHTLEIGRTFESTRLGPGHYQIAFKPPGFDFSPIVVVTPDNHSQCVARIALRDTSKIEIVMRTVPANDFLDEGFCFIVLEGKPPK